MTTSAFVTATFFFVCDGYEPGAYTNPHPTFVSLARIRNCLGAQPKHSWTAPRFKKTGPIQGLIAVAWVEDAAAAALKIKPGYYPLKSAVDSPAAFIASMALK